MAFRFEGLEIWHKARAYATEVYALTAKFPRHEDYGLRSQMNRAVNSIGLNIAEGSARSTKKAFDYYLEMAVGSTFEVVAHRFSPTTEPTSQKKSNRMCTTMGSSWGKASMRSAARCARDSI